MMSENTAVIVFAVLCMLMALSLCATAVLACIWAVAAARRTPVRGVRRYVGYGAIASAVFFGFAIAAVVATKPEYPPIGIMGAAR